jgi:membrane protein YqaA with SNARE-associated domain
LTIKLFEAEKRLFGKELKYCGVWLLYLILAYCIAICLNYVLGILCFKVLSPINSRDVEHSKMVLDRFKNSKIIYLLLMLSVVPFFGKFIVLFSGFCRIKFKTVLIISILTKLVYYSFLIFST